MIERLFHVREAKIERLLSRDSSAARTWSSMIPRFPEATTLRRDEPPLLRDNA
jgi:hypothetical protein